MEQSLALLAWQRTLFAPQPRRLALMKLPVPADLEPLRLRVHRNHAFEPVASVIPPFLALRRWQADFVLGAYDDSLTTRGEGDVRAEIVWLDYARYAPTMAPRPFAEWLLGRLTALRQASGNPVLLVNWPELPTYAAAVESCFAAAPPAGIRLASLAGVAAALGPAMYDERAARISGTRLSDAALVRCARELGCRWLPALLAPRLKAVALDLDQTLYAGVLGEDGPEGVVLTPAHRALQEALVQLHRSGVFLALVSRNEPADVEELFARRPDFPLRREHFSSCQVSWRPKPEALIEAAQELRIGLEAMLFVDDNLGELAAAAAACPALWLLHADADAGLTHQALEYYPGLWAAGVSETDGLRTKDLEAGQTRARLAAEAVDPAAYLRSLQIRLTFAVNPQEQRQRIWELSQKTNQFNLALRRLDEVEVDRRLGALDGGVVTFRLADRLADSGIVGVLFARATPEAVLVDELCISCRALGRNLEDLMIAQALRLACLEWGGRRLYFEQTVGPRNAPARQWLQGAAGAAYAPEQKWVEVPAAFLDSPPNTECVTMAVTTGNG